MRARSWIPLAGTAALLTACASQSPERAESPPEASGYTAQHPAALDGRTVTHGPDEKGDIYSKRPVAEYDPAGGGGDLSLEGGAWRLAVRANSPEEAALGERAHAAAIGWFEAYNRTSRPLADPPRSLWAIRAGDGLYVFPCCPKKVVVGASCALPVLVLNFREEAVGIEVSASGEGEVDVRPASGQVLQIPPGRMEEVSFEIVARTAGRAGVRIEARIEASPEPFWQTAIFEVGPAGG
ncbi:MAG: hypothetical protein HY720_10755 [Planctomycetes bacterium]|nr:hypothetical protein [Planctomycetota bacterium]